MSLPELKADCGRCAALCCMALALDRSQDFAIDKPAGLACPHLGPDHLCAIHAVRRDRGFAGCIGYDCLGAGQRVVQELFGGRSWLDDPGVKARMIDAFRAMRSVHRHLELVALAGQLPLEPELEAERDALLEALDPPGGWTEQRLAEFEEGPVPPRVRAFLARLAPVAEALRRMSGA